MSIDKPTRAEDEYFIKQELERRKKWAAEQAEKMVVEEKTRLRELHFMKCPKCGMDLQEIDLHGVTVDECSSCGGIFLDHGEIHFLIEAAKKNEGIIGKLFSAFY